MKRDKTAYEVAACVAVLGAGAWGTSLACTAARAGCQTTLWGRDQEVLREISQSGQNRKYLADLTIRETIAVSGDIVEAVRDTDIVIVATPAQTIGALSEALADLLRPSQIILLTAKGIDRDTGLLPHEIASQNLRGFQIASLSGPSFATDVVRGLPTAVTIAAHDIELAMDLSEALSSATFRCYASSDPVGVELGGALKNVLALAVGAARGLELGASAEAALIARGFAEMQRLAKARGADPHTLSGLSGLGDLVLTCSSTQSRNFNYGLMMGQNKPLGDLPLAEGVHTARAALAMARANAIDMPIVEAVDAVISGASSIEDAVSGLLNRPLRLE